MVSFYFVPCIKIEEKVKFLFFLVDVLILSLFLIISNCPQIGKIYKFKKKSILNLADFKPNVRFTAHLLIVANIIFHMVFLIRKLKIKYQG